MSDFGFSNSIVLKKQKPHQTQITEHNFLKTYEKNLKSGVVNEDLFSSANIKNYVTLTAYSSIYTRVSEKMKEIIKSVEAVRYFYLVDVMLNQIVDDALAPKIGSDDLFHYSHQDEAIQEELNELKKRCTLDQLIYNIAPEILAYGEYTLKTKIGKSEKKKSELSKEEKEFVVDGKGVLDIQDIVDQGSVVTLSQDGEVTNYIVYDELAGRIEVKEKADYIKFSMGGSRIKIPIEELIPVTRIKNPQVKEVVDKIPRFLRTGKSVLYSIIPKIKELEILEKLIPATKINKLSQGNLIGMNLPENYSLEEALEAIQRIESMVNKKISVDPVTQEITVEAILSTAGKTKVIPLFGDKGRLEQMDFRDNEPDDLLNVTKEIRELILDSIGIPSELVFKSDGDSKADILKRYAKYIRKLKKLQKTISSGLKEIAYIHLANKGIKFKKEDVEVQFNNSLIEIDNLDKLEHADVTVGMLRSVKEFFSDLAEENSPFRDNINLAKVLEWIDENLKTIGLSDAVISPKEGGAEPDTDAVATDGVDSQGNPTSDNDEQE